MAIIKCPECGKAVMYRLSAARAINCGGLFSGRWHWETNGMALDKVCKYCCYKKLWK